MTIDAVAARTPVDEVEPPPRARRRDVIRRHTVVVRLWHWMNAACIFMLLGSGLNIFNAHPRLYWGGVGTWGSPSWLSIHAADSPHGRRGVLEVGGLTLDTTGVLGRFREGGNWAERAWPGWITLPSYQDLADSRHLHFFFAWILVVSGVAFLLWSVISRHLQRDLWPTARDVRRIPRSVWDHVRLRHPRGEAAKRYDVLQKLAYLGVFALVVGMVATGATMSPGFNAVAPGLLELFGGRQSARTLHFLFASGVALFIFVHLVEVVLAGPVNELRSMITGRYAVPPPRHPREEG